MSSTVELLKLLIPVIVAVIGGVISITQILKNAKLTRLQKIEQLLTVGVNMAENLGKAGKITSSDKKNWALSFVLNSVKLTDDEMTYAKNFIENAFVAFFTKPLITGGDGFNKDTDEAATNEPVAVIPATVNPTPTPAPAVDNNQTPIA